MPSSPNWLSTPQAAEYLGITTRTLYRLIDEGEVAAHRMGRVIRLRPKDLDAYIENSRIEPGSLSSLYPDTLASKDAKADTADA